MTGLPPAGWHRARRGPREELTPVLSLQVPDAQVILRVGAVVSRHGAAAAQTETRREDVRSGAGEAGRQPARVLPAR